MPGVVVVSSGEAIGAEVVDSTLDGDGIMAGETDSIAAGEEDSIADEGIAEGEGPALTGVVSSEGVSDLSQPRRAQESATTPTRLMDLRK